MEFNSIDFMLFFPIVVAIYFAVPKKLRQFWLLAASYFFYMSWNFKYAALIAASTLLTFFFAILMEKCGGGAKKEERKKVMLILCLVINLGILFLFKYGDFTISTVSKISRLLGIGTIDKRFGFLLPVGISFYTFQALGYMIDVYRGDICAEKSLVRYALFVSFFPQLVAGPIERSKNLLPQMQNISNIRLWNADRITSGAILMLWGYFMKMVIADRAAILVNTVFEGYRMYGSTELILAAVCFTLQIYCDFGSYSLIAIGAAKIMGFTLMENFNTPYFAASLHEFWGRWHISLSSWFRDYLYIPLGGNRKGFFRKEINKLVVFLCSGLWHGAKWSFVVWGALHGIGQVIGDCSASIRRKWIQKLHINTQCFSWKLLQVGGTFAFTAVAWIFFRADSIGDALSYLHRIWIRPTPWLLFDGGVYTLGLDRVEMNILEVAVALLFLVDLVRYRKGITIDAFLMRQNLWFRWLFMIGLILVIFVFGKYGSDFDPQQFIYFQF